MPIARVGAPPSVAGIDPFAEEEGSQSAGSSSSTSESKPEQSGQTPPETEQSTLSRAQDAENPSRERPQARQKSGSTARSTTGGTRKTG